MTPDAQLVDARGLLCPWPALRLSRAARMLAGPAILYLLADDPAAPREVAQLCAAKGWSFAPDPANSTGFTIGIR